MSETDYNDHDSALMRVLDFTAEDLQANRDGYLTKAQRQRLNKQRFRSRAESLFLFIFAFGAAVTLIFLMKNENAARMDTAIVIFVFLVGYIAWYMFKSRRARRHYRQLDADLYKGSVAVVQGVLRKDAAAAFGRPLNQSFQIEIGELVFPGLTTLTTGVFEKHRTYRIYYLPNTRTILSAEKVDL